MNKDYNSSKIEILPEHIIDQIKAGEVLERPASLIKELIENSLDAFSTEINLHIVENGLDLLSIEDNGRGMDFPNLPYAFLRHATSKLKNYDDLYRLQSFGFRGEALASVASSARITCTTQPMNLKIPGGKIIIHGGAQELLIPYQSNTHGTSIFIKDLFYNTPARLKFIKSKVSEKSALKKMIYAFVLSNPQTMFSIKWDVKDREIFKALPIEDIKKRIQQVFYSKMTKTPEAEIWSSSEFYQDYKVEVFFSPSTSKTPQYRHHYLFANNRFFQDKSLHLSVLRTLEPIWRHGESGHYIIKMTVPPHELDVNVHPNKTQIKFMKSDVLYSLLVTSLRSALKSHAVSVNNSLASVTDQLGQSQFFSREENQSFDLLNMSAGQYSSNDQFSDNALRAPNNSQYPSNESSILGSISPSIILIGFDNKFFISDIKKLMAEFILNSLNLFINNDDLAGPLLISEPFKIPKGKIDSHFEDLKNLGFELDRLNSEVIVLRTLPRFVPQNISRDITMCIINFFIQNKTSHFEDTLLKKFIETNWTAVNTIPFHTLSNILETLLKKFKGNSDFKNSALVLLEDQNMKSLFK